jgi:hypothetical protein
VRLALGESNSKQFVKSINNYEQRIGLVNTYRQMKASCFTSLRRLDSRHCHKSKCSMLPAESHRFRRRAEALHALMLGCSAYKGHAVVRWDKSRKELDALDDAVFSRIASNKATYRRKSDVTIMADAYNGRLRTESAAPPCASRC